MSWLLNGVYLLAIAAASPWLVYQAIRRGKYRQGLAAKLLGRVPRRSSERPAVWFHAVSVGEVNLLRQLIARFEERYPEYECVVSTTTRSGFELARQLFAPRLVFYCPLDFSWAVSAALARVRPQMLVLAELELWPNLIRAARRADASVVIVNARMSDGSYRGYRRIRPLIRRVLSQLDAVFTQSETYAARFRELGVAPERVAVTGSLKFDGALSDRENSQTRRLARLAGIGDGDLVLLAGSTYPPEEEHVLSAYRRLLAKIPQLRLILVPRHAERFEEVARMVAGSGLSWRRRTEITTEVDEPCEVLLVDVVGELGAWWGTAHIGFVGGSMGSRGGQNMIEPAAYGVAVSFGPRTGNFRDVVAMLLEADAARVVHDEEELVAFVRRAAQDAEFRDGLGSRAQALVLSQLGATEQTVEELGRKLGGPAGQVS